MHEKPKSEFPSLYSTVYSIVWDLQYGTMILPHLTDLMVVEIVPQMDQQDQAAEQAEQTKTNQSIIENILRFIFK